MDNRHHLAVDSQVTLANGYGERDDNQSITMPIPMSPTPTRLFPSANDNDS